MKTQIYPLLLSLFCLFCASAFAETEKPNIVLIFVDDMGYGDATSYNPDAYVETPAIDKLAEGGVRFTSGYVTAPVCYPSRVGLMTGAYQARFGVYDNLPAAPIPEEQALMPEAMEAAGYATAVIGKWNNVKTDRPRELVDHTAHIMGWKSNFWVSLNTGRATSSLANWGPPEGTAYITEMLTDEAVNFIDGQNNETPFFVYLAYNAPHDPIQALEKHRDAVAHLPTEPERVYAAMLLSIDEGVGRVMNKLEEKGLTENTMVAFVSDNGPATGRTKWAEYPNDWPEVQLGSAGPFRGAKFNVYEGGIRLPFILHYPAKLPAGEVEDRPVITFDLYRTFLSQANVQPAEGAILDGKDLIPYLLDQPDQQIHEHLVWDDRMGGNQVAVRKGDWKLFIDNSEKWGINARELYNLAEDIDESDNVIEANPEKVAELKEIYIRWLEAMHPDVGDYVQVDNSDTEHLRLTGDWETATEAQWEREDDYLTDGNSGKGEKTARFTLPLEQPGYYELEAIWPKKWPEGTVRAERVPVTIAHYGGSTTVYLNQNDSYDDNKVTSEYVKLGKFYFGEEGGSVTFSNEGTEGLVIVDAIRFLNWSIQDKVSPRRWRRIYWGAQVPGPEIMSEDTDDDGLINLEEFALGLHPLLADSHPAREKGLKLAVDRETNEPELSFEGLGDRQGLVYRLERSPDLGEWSPLARWIAGEDVTRSPETITFRDSASTEGGAFYKLVPVGTE